MFCHDHILTKRPHLLKLKKITFCLSSCLKMFSIIHQTLNESFSKIHRNEKICTFFVIVCVLSVGIIIFALSPSEFEFIN